MTATPILRVSARAQFLMLVSHGQLLKANAIVLLCGEDTAPRIAMALQLAQHGGAPLIVCTGGRAEHAGALTASAAAAVLYGQGFAPNKVILESASQNTKEQAANVVALAVAQGWTRLLLVASPYHAPRAFLTFLHALTEAGQQERIRLINAPASQSAWSQCPEGMTDTRLALLDADLAKVTTYAADVAPYAYGVSYLQWWEPNP